MRKFIKRILLIAAIVFSGLFLASLAIATVFGDEIGAQILNELNKQIKSELSVKSVNLSLLKGFPNVSADLRGVILEDAFDGVLLEAGTISFRFSLLSLLTSSIKVKSVAIEDGAIFITKNKAGTPNYDILKEAYKPVQASGEKSDFGLSLERAQFQDVELIYVDEKVEQEIVMIIEDATFSGEFSSTTFSLESIAVIRSNFIELPEGRYLAGKDFAYEGIIDVDLSKGLYDIKEFELVIGSSLFNVDGFVEHTPEYSDFDLVLSAKEGNIEALLQLLPEQYLVYFNDLKSRGTFHCDASILGKWDTYRKPSVEMNISLENGRISTPLLGSTLKEVSFSASFNNGKKGKNKDAVFEITNFKGYLDRELTELKLRIEDLDNPYISFILDGNIPMASIHGLFNNPAITDGAGELEIKGLELKGLYKDMQSIRRISRVKATGEIEFDDTALTINGEEMTIDRGRLQVKGNTLEIEGVKLEGAGSEMVFNGNCHNLLPVLFADSSNSSNSVLEFNSSLTARSMDLGRLLSITALQVEEEDVDAAVFDSLQVAHSEKRSHFTNFLKGVFQAQVEALNYHKIEGQDFKGKLEFDHNEVFVKGEVNGMGGRISLDGSGNLEQKPHLHSQLILEDIDIREFFRQAENFGQEMVQFKHLKGTMEAKVAIYSYWDEEGNFQKDQLKVLAGVNVRDGELIRLKMLEDFSTYIKTRDLRHIKFANMQNWIEISEEKLHLPAMFIQSNALNITLSGEHNFENEYEYNMKINAGQVLWNKFKKHDPALKPVASRKKGFFNMYFNISGTPDTYKVNRKKRQVKSGLERSVHRKREIEAALIREFGKIEFLEEPEEWKDVIPEYDDEDPDEVEYLEGF